MEVEIISSKDNKLLDRKEINAVVHFEGATPARKEIREAVSTKVGLNPDLTVLSSIVNEFGAKQVRVLAHSYNDMKKLMETEPEYLRKREGIGVPKEEAPKAEEKPAEKKPEEKKEKEEKPKEEKKEEKPKEEPKEKKPEPEKEEKKEEKPRGEKKEEKKKGE
jgi:ribosomal protein S24E